jgi:ribonuclease III
LTSRRASLTARLGYTFDDPSLLDAALTHRSVGARHNERLEFLGDAVLNLVVAESLYRRHPGLDEGGLTRLRASLVRAEALAELGRALELGEVIELGPGEMKSGGFRRDSILGDAVEAMVGAVYLDGGFDRVREVVNKLYGERLDRDPDSDALKDAKTRLQEWLQGRQMDLPEYQLLETSGEPHCQTFVVACELPALAMTTRGSGGSRRKAEQEAAAAALERLDGR